MPRVQWRQGGGFASATEWTAGRAIACGSQVIVPVLRIGARVAGAPSSRDASAPTGAGVGGSGFAEFVAAWIREENGRVQWLPRDPAPPEGADDWPQWLAQRPDLQVQIENSARGLAPGI